MYLLILIVVIWACIGHRIPTLLVYLDWLTRFLLRFSMPVVVDITWLTAKKPFNLPPWYDLPIVRARDLATLLALDRGFGIEHAWERFTILARPKAAPRDQAAQPLLKEEVINFDEKEVNVVVRLQNSLTTKATDKLYRGGNRDLTNFDAVNAASCVGSSVAQPCNAVNQCRKLCR